MKRTLRMGAIIVCLASFALSQAQSLARLAAGSFEELGRMPPGQVWLVPFGGDRLPMASIRDAIEAAISGDTILLSDGRFAGPDNRGVLVSGKDIVVESMNGPEACVIDCMVKDRAFEVQGTGVSQATVFRGITFTRGGAGSGGAMVVHDGAEATIEQCLFVGNGDLGPGFQISFGGAVFHSGSSAFPVVRDCLFFGNKGSTGGALWLGRVLVERCAFIDNAAAFGNGGALFATRARVRSCIFQGNQARWGGSAFLSGGDGLVQNCTLVDNQAERQGGAVYFEAPATIVSSILWGNEAGNAGMQAYQDCFFGCLPGEISFSVVEGGMAGVLDESGQGPSLPGLVVSDPLFVDAAAGDYRLSDLSPCVDAGDPGFVPAVGETDMEGDPRLIGTAVDIGADEFVPLRGSRRRTIGSQGTCR